VEIEDGLDPSRHAGIFYACKLVPGVRSVTDLEHTTQATLDSYLMGPTEVVVLPERVEQPFQMELV
jgi:hypothetical protein